MPAPIDLSQIPARTPASRSPYGSGGRGARGTGHPALDEYARKVLWVAFFVSLLLLGFLLAGLWSGAWSKAAMGALTHASRERQMENIAFAFRCLQFSTLVFLISFLIVMLNDESVGYVLLATGALFYAGLPFLTQQIYDWRGLKISVATGTLLRDFQTLSWLFFLPGLIWTAGDLLRRFRNASETAAIQRANIKYGASVHKQPIAKQKQRFLGRCWELPYCRDSIREKCPVFIKKRGPCWWYKEGCMCEERIVLQAIISTDWKQQAAKADAAYNYGQKRSSLTPAAKRQRCRNCIIYNEHQRQKYKLLVAVTLILVPVLLYLNVDAVQAFTNHLLTLLEIVMDRFSFNNQGLPKGYQPPAAIEWTLIVAVSIIALSQVLKFIEFLCFKIKV